MRKSRNNNVDVRLAKLGSCGWFMLLAKIGLVDKIKKLCRAILTVLVNGVFL